MPNPVIANLQSAVDKAQGAMASATVLINGIAAKIAAAIESALVNGATAEELAPIQAEVDQLNSDSDALAAAVASNP